MATNAYLSDVAVVAVPHPASEISCRGAGLSDAAATDLAGVFLDKRAALLRYFTLRLNSEAEAEDVVQDIYVRLATVEIGPIENPVSYLYRLGTNLMLDRVRKSRRTEARDDAWQESRHVRAGGEDIANEPPADAVVAGRQRLAKMLDALETLPPQRRKAFRLHKLEGFSHAATAEAMGISRSAVEKHIMAALGQLIPILRE